MPPASLRKIIQLISAFSPFMVLAGIVVLQSQEYKKTVQQLNRADYLAQEQEQARLVNWQQHSPSLGFNNLKADMSYLDYVQYFGDKEARDTIGYKLVPKYFEAIASIDPRFTQAHLSLSVGNSMYAGNPEITIALMEKVLASVEPKSEDAAYLWTSKGLDELLFMGDKQAAIESHKMAVEWANLTKGDRPDELTIKNFEAALADTSEIDIKQAQVTAWSSVLVYIRDNQRQREILDKINSLKAEIAALKQESAVQ